MAGKKKKKKIEIVTKRIKEHGFKVTEGKDRFKSKTITLYERGDQTHNIALLRAMWRGTSFSAGPFWVCDVISTMDKI